MVNIETIRDNLVRVEERIEAAKARSGASAEVDLVAVTKGHPPELLERALAAGLTRLGENRVQELESKVEVIGRDRCEWHLVGHLQRNKVRQVLPLFDLIHSINSQRLANALSREALRAEREVSGLIQVNTSGEESKSGFTAAEVVDAVGAITELPGLRVVGVMTMAPFTDDEDTLRRTFIGAREIFERCAAEVPAFEARHLSMGMTNDFEIAVEEGSTMVRLGTVLFGEREL